MNRLAAGLPFTKRERPLVPDDRFRAEKDAARTGFREPAFRDFERDRRGLVLATRLRERAVLRPPLLER